MYKFIYFQVRFRRDQYSHVNCFEASKYFTWYENVYIQKRSNIFTNKFIQWHIEPIRSCQSCFATTKITRNIIYSWKVPKNVFEFDSIWHNRANHDQQNFKTLCLLTHPTENVSRNVRTFSWTTAGEIPHRNVGKRRETCSRNAIRSTVGTVTDRDRMISNHGKPYEEIYFYLEIFYYSQRNQIQWEWNSQSTLDSRGKLKRGRRCEENSPRLKIES